MKKLFALALTATMFSACLTPAYAAESAAEALETAAAVLEEGAAVSVTGGLISGTANEDGSVMMYKGIPYAAAPVGDLRWKAPQPVLEWEGVRPCDSFGACEYQTFTDTSVPGFLDSHPWMACYTQEFIVDNAKEYASEDCLFLNVWAPAGEVEEGRPVLVYFHGGGFGEGSGALQAYDGETIAKNDAIHVTVNYRLGTFGFLSTPELDAESETGCSGNYGLMDQVAALKWIQENIAQFGGDPENVTIAGQSAGGMAVTYLVQSGKAAGLFKNAVVMSGNYVRGGSPSLSTTKEDAQAMYAEKYPDLTIEDLKAASSSQAWFDYAPPFKAIVDGDFITAQTTDDFVAGNCNKVNNLLSCVKGDAVGFFGTPVLTNADEYIEWVNQNFGDYAEKVLEMYPAEEGADFDALYQQVLVDRLITSYICYAKLNEYMELNTFVAYFDHTMPGEYDCGAFHTADVPYWVGAKVREEYWTELDQQISDTMVSYMVNFAKNSDPNNDGAPEWKVYDGSYSYLHIGETIEMAELDQAVGDFWVEYFNTTSLGGALN